MSVFQPFPSDPAGGRSARASLCGKKEETLSFDISSIADVEQPTQVHIGGQSVYRGDWPE